jgi:hypothetical protein
VTTLTQPKLGTLTTGYALWMNIPGPVRRLLRARVPLHCEEHGGGECLIVSVGSGVPLRWLQVAATAEGHLACRLWEVRQRNKQLAAEQTTADGLTAVLQRWAVAYGLAAN